MCFSTESTIDNSEGSHQHGTITDQSASGSLGWNKVVILITGGTDGLDTLVDCVKQFVNPSLSNSQSNIPAEITVETVDQAMMSNACTFTNLFFCSFQFMDGMKNFFYWFQSFNQTYFFCFQSHATFPKSEWL
jgi:hypothetical protein